MINTTLLLICGNEHLLFIDEEGKREGMVRCQFIESLPRLTMVKNLVILGDESEIPKHFYEYTCN